VLALQGDFEAHAVAVRAAGGDAVEVRTAEAVADVDALILPGGESTTIGKLMGRYGLDVAIRDAADAGKPIFGTCAGMILLAKRITEGEKRGGQPTLGLMEIGVARNAFGRGVFIRAPEVTEVGAGVETLATYDGRTVLVRQGNLLACAFHPELTDDTRVHAYFLSLTRGEAGTDTTSD
jgi:pyridoxal 5'-phosphate synthase pdxT subunit